MSWDSYIDNLIGNSKSADGTAHIDKACIFGKDGAPYTTDGHTGSLVASAAEKAKIFNELNKGDQCEFGATGIVLGGTKYQFLRIDSDSRLALGKKKGSGSITVQGTSATGLVIVAHCPEGAQHGNCNDAVQKVITYLAGSGY
ncbi:profilin-like [Rhopilema esculentum]|uniref:profilin-like n=1 Tax=Rhopilema esculentum TaxID=499914 RepID=UPI0031D1B76F|eukprot:gene12164-2776_t